MTNRSSGFWPVTTFISLAALVTGVSVALLLVMDTNRTLSHHMAALSSEVARYKEDQTTALHSVQEKVATIGRQIPQMTQADQFIVQSAREIRVLAGGAQQMQVETMSGRGATVTLGAFRVYMGSGEKTEFVHEGDLCYLHLVDSTTDYALFRSGCTKIADAPDGID